MPSIIQRPSPNKSGTLKPRYIMLHHTASTVFEAVVRFFMRLTSRVSAHYVVGKAGEIAQMVPLTKKAWHAGLGGPYGLIPRNAGNTYCVGIEIVNKGDGDDPYPIAQLKALDWLINHIDTELGRELPIIDHKMYAPRRKTDMSANFPLANYRKYRRFSASSWIPATVAGPRGAITMRADRSPKADKLRSIENGKRVKVFSKTAVWSFAEYGGQRGYVLTTELKF